MKIHYAFYLPILLFSLFVSCNNTKTDTIKPDVYNENEIIQRFNFEFTYGEKKYSDLGILMFPKQYHTNVATKLIIYCHSGGGFVSNTSSEVETQDYAKYFVSLGYIVMDVNGIPDEIVKSKKIDGGRTVGNGLTLQEYVAAYNDVISKYKIDLDHVYIFSNSNGGAIASNIVNLTTIKIKAQAGICPLLAIKENAWFIDSGKVGNGEFSSLQNRSNIIRLYGMKDAITQEELNVAKYEEDKVGKYDPFEYLKSSKTGYKTLYKIFQPKDDPKVSYKIALKFADFANRNGTKVFIRSFETGGHTSEPQTGDVGLYTYKSTNYKLTPTVYEVSKWFEENEGMKTKIF